MQPDGSIGKMSHFRQTLVWCESELRESQTPCKQGNSFVTFSDVSVLLVVELAKESITNHFGQHPTSKHSFRRVDSP
jgi:hypothetical protein